MKKFRYPVNLGLIIFQLLLIAYLMHQVLTDGYLLEIRHLIGIIFTVLTFVTVFINKNVFTLALGFILLLGNFCGLSLFVSINQSGFFFNPGSLHIPLYWGQPAYTLMLIVYLVFSKDFFIGIGTKAYWKDFLSRKEDLEHVVTTVN